MSLPELPSGHIYFAHGRTWTLRQIANATKYWDRLVRLEQITPDDRKSLYEKFFGDVNTIQKFEDMEGKRHNVQCSYATETSCTCWCRGKYHGSAVQTVISIGRPR